MATPTNACVDAINFIEKEISLEIGIVNNNVRREIHEIIKSKLLMQITSRYIYFYDSLTSEKNKSSSSALTVSYFIKCCQFANDMINVVLEQCQTNNVTKDVTARDITVLMNFYSSKTLQSLNVCRPSASKTRVLEEEAATATAETIRTLLCIGGGTLGDIIRASNKRMKLVSISAEQRRQASQQLAIAKSVCMSLEEKCTLPADLQARDRGGMYFPKCAFMSFLANAVAATVEYACHNAMKKYGASLLKMCASDLLSNTSLRHNFDEAYCSMNISVHSPGNVNKFAIEWIRKIVHARLGEYVSGFVEGKAAERGKTRIRGGQTLRDTLFAATELSRQAKKKKAASQKGIKATGATSPSDAVNSRPAQQQSRHASNSPSYMSTPCAAARYVRSMRPRRIGANAKRSADFVYD